LGLNPKKEFAFEKIILGIKIKSKNKFLGKWPPKEGLNRIIPI